MQALVIALYSDDSSVRHTVISALGKQLDPTLALHEIKEFATADALRLYVDNKKQVDLFILDGEAVPEGGMGVGRQLKDEVFPTFLEFVGSHNESVLVAHNAPFDLSFLKSAAKELDYPWPKYKSLDTVTVARQVLTKEEVADCKLGTLAQFFGTKTEPNHRALDDAKATVEVLHGLLERLGSLQITTLEGLLEFAKTAAHIQRQNYWGLRST